MESNTIMIGGSAKEYAQKVIAAINPENLGAVFKGYLSFPVFKDKQVEIRMNSDNGSITSPGFRQDCDENLFVQDQIYHYVLETEGVNDTTRLRL